MPKKKTPVDQEDLEVKKIAKALYERTFTHIGKYFDKALTTPAPPVIPTKLKAIVEAVDEGDWGCQRNSVVKLVSAICGSDITQYLKNEKSSYISIDENDMVVGVMLVPTRCENDHSYRLELPVMATTPKMFDNFLEDTGRINYHCIDEDVNCLRLPLLSEVEDFVKTCKNDIKKYIVLS